MFKLSRLFQAAPVVESKATPRKVDVALVDLEDAFPDFDEAKPEVKASSPLMFEAASRDVDDVDSSVIEIRVKTDVKDFEVASVPSPEAIEEPEPDTLEQASNVRSDYSDSNLFTSQAHCMTPARLVVSVERALYDGNVRDESSTAGNMFLPNDVMFDEVFEKRNMFEEAPEGVTPKVPEEKLRFDFV